MVYERLPTEPDAWTVPDPQVAPVARSVPDAPAVPDAGAVPDTGAVLGAGAVDNNQDLPSAPATSDAQVGVVRGGIDVAVLIPPQALVDAPAVSPLFCVVVCIGTTVNKAPGLHDPPRNKSAEKK